MHEGPIVMPHLVLPPPMLPLALEAPSTPTKLSVERECPGAPRCARHKPKHRGVQWALDGFDDEQPQRGFDSAETLEMLPEPSLDEDAFLETIDARLEVVLREAAQFDRAAMRDAVRAARQAAARQAEAEAEAEARGQRTVVAEARALVRVRGYGSG